MAFSARHLKQVSTNIAVVRSLLFQPVLVLRILLSRANSTLLTCLQLARSFSNSSQMRDSIPKKLYTRFKIKVSKIEHVRQTDQTNQQFVLIPLSDRKNYKKLEQYHQPQYEISVNIFRQPPVPHHCYTKDHTISRSCHLEYRRISHRRQKKKPGTYDGRH